MDVRRRTLASEGPLGNALPSSAIPVPSSAIKKPPSRLGSSRLSMMPTNSQQNLREAARSRVSSNSNHQLALPQAVGGLGMSTSNSGHDLAGRRSTVRNGEMSAPRGDGGFYGRTPQTQRSLPSSIRRSSVFMGGRQSMVPASYPSASIKDNRPIRDPTFKSNCIKNISEYLNYTRCPLPLTSKTLVSPTTKEFQGIFRFLVQDLLDPGMTWGKKFEDDCLQVLKDLKYPSPEGLGRTALGAAGDPQQWPKLLSMLNWLVELCRAHDHWCDPDVVSDPMLMPARELPLDYPNLEDRLLWDFSSKAYQQWFDDGAEEFTEAEQELEEMFDQMTQATFEECEKMETELQKRTVELQQLQAQEPPLKKLEEEYVQLMSDKTKFIGYIDMHRDKAEKMRQVMIRARAAISDHDKQIDDARTELSRIELAVSAQNLSPEEVTRMNDSRESLNRQLEDLRTRISTVMTEAYNHEMQVTRAMDRFEQLLSDYIVQAQQIGLMRPIDSLGLPSAVPTNVDFNLDVDLRLEDLAEIQTAARRMRMEIRPSLYALSESVRKESEQLAHGQIALEDNYDRLAQEVERQREEAKTLEMRLKLVNDQADEAKAQLQADTAETNRTVAKLEAEVTAVSAASEQGVVNAQGELDRKRIEFDQLREKTALLQDTMITQISSHIDIIWKAKDHTANSLKSVRTFAEAQ
ncbi:hypothetical protein M231_00593 [Tremella mesenterica]|uniref:Kinetochore protein NDC80 n=1 Tax=Tremella mesenterica TaxID=5217 RepID=A0A4Q1BVS4_TREME|nr:hypothetical protein M231_00593 [Tremella mesenterica]